MNATFQYKNLLLVDDEPSLVTVLKGFLEEEGYFVESAENGKMGLQRYQGARWDVVITDHAMPEMNGEEMAKQIKLREPNLPIILITGCREAITNPDQFDAILLKPFRFAALLTCLSNTLESNSRASSADGGRTPG